MVNIPTQQNLADFGIDTVERAIIFSATILRSLYVRNSPQGGLDRTIQIANRIDADKSAYVLIEANLPYSIVDANEEGGLIIEHIISQNYPIDYNLDLEYACTNTLGISQQLPYLDGTTYDSLEKFFVFYSYLLQASLASVSDIVSIRQLDSFSKEAGQLKINLKLEFGYDTWLSGSNYVCSCLYTGLIYRQLPTRFKTGRSTLFDNSSTIGNDFLVGN